MKIKKPTFKYWRTHISEKQREAVKMVSSLPKEKRDQVMAFFKNLFVELGISSKDGKIISRRKLRCFQRQCYQHELAMQREQEALAQKPSKKLK